ncbi:dihydrofolate reductase [Peterkaempfera sp. SMS 1(5)a]|uniref:dihydrofolate reductase n=1 Tax=Peterkaempfera podocarpi TaxID=3232308 RepID=UPI00366C8560
MTRIITDISVSLDGFATRPGPSPDNGPGTRGEAVHTWAVSDDPSDRWVLREGSARPGTVALGHLFDVVDGPKGWHDTPCYGAGEVEKPSFAVVTSSPPQSVRTTNRDCTSVTIGLPDAVPAAHEPAEAAEASDSAKNLDVIPMGGGATIGSALEAGLVDALTLHLAPIVPDTRTPVSTGEVPRTPVQHSVTSTPTATHLTYDFSR